MEPAKARKAFGAVELTAVLCGAALFIWLFAIAPRSIGLPDETFYHTVPQRLLQGDRLFVEEWHYSQLAFLFDVLPYWLFVRITGGTAGIVLYMRRLFIAADLLFYVWSARKLRRYGFAGVFSAFAFCAVIPQTIPAFCYHSVAPMATAAFGLLLIPEEKQSPGPVKLVLAGLAAACAVLAEPLLLFGFGAYALVVLLRLCLRKKRTVFPDAGFLLDLRVFCPVLAGAVAAFIVFMTYFAASGSLSKLPEILPALLTDREFNSSNLIDLTKLASAIRFYGVLPPGVSAAALAAAAVYRFGKKTSETFRRAVFIAACAGAAACYLWAGLGRLLPSPGTYLSAFIQYHGVPALLWAPAMALLTKQPHARLTAGVWLGVVYTVCVDISSANVLGAGGRLAAVPGAIAFADILCGLSDEKEAPEKTPAKKKQPQKAPAVPKLALPIAAAAAAAVLALWQTAFPLLQGLTPPQESVYLKADAAALTEHIEAGPCRGLVTAPAVRDVYDRTLRDLDAIRTKADGGVAVAELAPWIYLYLDMPIDAYSSWFSVRDTDRLVSYWTLLPEKRPAYIYVPYCDMFSYRRNDRQALLMKLAEAADFEQTEGEAGYILRVTSWRI